MHPFPAAAAQSAPTSVVPRAPAAPAAVAGGAVLVVHADVAVRRGIGAALQSAGLSMVPASSAEAAMRLPPQAWSAALLQTPPGKADQVMELFQALRTQSSGLPVVLLVPANAAHTLPDADACLCESTPPVALAATLKGWVYAYRAQELLRQRESDWRAHLAQAQLHAHALRNPLNAILMSAQVLTGMHLPKSAQRAVDAICRNAQVQAQVIADAQRAPLMPARNGAKDDIAQ